MAHIIKCWILLAIVSINLVVSAERERRQAVDIQELDPINEALLIEHSGSLEHDGRGDREKRLGLIKKIGLKAVLLNLIFGKIDGFIDAKTRLVGQLEKQNIAKNEKYFGFTLPPPPSEGFQKHRPVRPTASTASTEPPIVFSTSSPVSLVIPDRLYGSSFQLVTNISETIGDVLFNTADRAQEFADRLSKSVRSTFGFATNLLGNGASKSSRTSNKS